MKEQLVVSFLHSNYLITSSGTEKFVRELSNLLRKHGVHHLCCFSFYHDYGGKSIGVIYDDCFCGVFRYEEIKKIILGYINEKNLYLKAIHIHNFLNHDLSILADVAQTFSRNTVVFVHDFYIICNRYKLINSANHFCGLAAPCHMKCKDCDYEIMGEQHFERMKAFLSSISENLFKIVCPSQYVQRAVAEVYPEFAPLTVVRQHLAFEGTYPARKMEGRIKLAYCGLQVEDKGYDAWCELVHALNEKSLSIYEFFYFGTGDRAADNVTNVYVSAAEQGENAMTNALREHEIDLVFMWTKCPETYSYVYYEAASSGAFVVTNGLSGNVCDEVRRRENGVVFQNFTECTRAFQDSEWIRDRIQKYRNNNEAFAPNRVTRNENLSQVLPETAEVDTLQREADLKCRKLKVKTAFYWLKHSKELRRIKTKGNG